MPTAQASPSCPQPPLLLPPLVLEAFLALWPRFHSVPRERDSASAPVFPVFSAVCFQFSRVCLCSLAEIRERFRGPGPCVLLHSSAMCRTYRSHPCPRQGPANPLRARCLRRTRYRIRLRGTVQPLCSSQPSRACANPPRDRLL